MRETRQSVEQATIEIDAATAARRIVAPFPTGASMDAVRLRILGIEGDSEGDPPLRFNARLLLAVRGTSADGGPFEHESLYDSTLVVDSLDDFREGVSHSAPPSALAGANSSPMRMRSRTGGCE